LGVGVTDHFIWRAAQVELATSLHLRKSITAIPNEPIFLMDTFILGKLCKPIYFADTKAKAVFSPDGPKPQFLIDTPNFKALVVGLETGGQVPA